jgi:hypothetical protein
VVTLALGMMLVIIGIDGEAVIARDRDAELLCAAGPMRRP